MRIASTSSSRGSGTAKVEKPVYKIITDVDGRQLRVNVNENIAEPIKEYNP